MIMIVHSPCGLTATPRQQVLWQITLIDQLLATTRTIWLSATDRSELKSKAHDQINVLLDRRLEFMRLRDEMAPSLALAAPSP